MEMSINNAKAALANPSAQLKVLLADPRVPEEARQGLEEAGLDVQSLGESGNGSKVEKGGDASAGRAESRVQVVDEHQNFTPKLSRYLDKWGLLDKGFAYDVVAVFGSQSTGKSTLLNRLFGTSFDVMDETKRQQTTKGIWLCPSTYSSTLVMDVEGTDGRERGEDQDFERKSALFSLASTEVLIVNLWEHQIGLYQGANMGLLKTVFEVNLSLFGGSAEQHAEGLSSSSHEKTMLLFVIRDHVGATPLKNLMETLTQDMEKIWSSLSKPDHLVSARLSDYFDLSFSALPHKILLPDKFEEAVVNLRKRFTDRSRPDYVFKPVYHKRIPADGVAFYMEGIWQKVLTNKDLDLPTQQELLAQFRCDEIAAMVLEAFQDASKGVRRPVESGSVLDGLGGMMNDWRTTALAKFDKDASRYHQAVYTRKRLDLLKAIDNALAPLFMGQLKNVHKRCVATFRTELVDGLKGEGYDFGKVVKEIARRVEKDFIERAEETQLKDTDWQFDDELALLRDDLKLIADQCRVDETKKMVNAIERSLRKQLAEPVEIGLAKPNAEMWDNLLRVFRAMLDKSEEVYLAKAKSRDCPLFGRNSKANPGSPLGFNCTEEENTASMSNLRRRAWHHFRAKVGEQLSDPAILAKLKNSFEDVFRYDAAGVPRVWSPGDDIDSVFRHAKDETLALIPLYAKIKPKDPSNAFTLPSDASVDASLDPDADFDFPSTLIIFSETKKLDLENRFKRDADAYYVEAKRSVVSSVAQIPVWMYGVLVVLGWNEAMYVLFNPLYLLLLVLLASSAYVVLQLGLVGPMLQVSRTVFNEVKTIAKDRLSEAFQDVQPQLEKPYTTSVGGGDGRARHEQDQKTGNPNETFLEK
ncbi:Dynamin-like GTPase that mediates homotypic ER fusion [Naganishia friedmannii]|uniref:Dynamin-like GTPase that mediates homotypic ER fusion n=1 Tax=Naganishia friedmannii TaxID=89922 RepID=A0ACC2W011_9TREE|nr:Dynamin-like GTPase that mediates homotypic ER fusion [Naganishia friedmannii]